jgi:chromosome segregation ATPase
MIFDSQSEKDSDIECREDELEDLEQDIIKTQKEISTLSNELEESKSLLTKLQARRKRKEKRLDEARNG